MRNLKLLSVLFAFTALVAIGCSKSNGTKGDTGATGPAGATGATGAAGPDSVLHSAWLSLNTPFVSDDSLYEESIAAAGITQDIIDNGAILAYLGFDDGSGGTQVLSANSGVFTDLQISYSVGAIQVLALDDYSGVGFRYVLIPGSILTGNSSGKKYTKQQVQSMSYQQVQKTFGLTN
jgi:hypothetical protein